MKYKNIDDDYFTEHFEELVQNHGGEWIVITKGDKIGVGPKHTVKNMLKIAQRRFPSEVYLVLPIPKEEDIGYVF